MITSAEVARHKKYVEGYSDAMEDVKYMAEKLGMPSDKIASVMEEFHKRRLEKYEQSTSDIDIPRLTLPLQPMEE